MLFELGLPCLESYSRRPADIFGDRDRPCAHNGTDRQRCGCRQQVPAVQAGAGACTLPQAESKNRVDIVKQERDRDANMPSRPDKTYKHDGWQGYGHWLGTGKLAGGKLAFMPFKKALAYARTLKLQGVNEWRWYFRLGRVYREKCSVAFFKICFVFIGTIVQMQTYPSA